jgi:hypothetical protein
MHNTPALSRACGYQARTPLYARSTTMSTISVESGTDLDHERAARRLSEEVIRDYNHLLKSKSDLEKLFANWKSVMALFRAYEKAQIIKKTPSDAMLEKHRNCMNQMIACAQMLSQVGERFLVLHHHLNETEADALRSEIAIVISHREILEFEYRTWTPTMPQADLEDAANRFFREPARKAS